MTKLSRILFSSVILLAGIFGVAEAGDITLSDLKVEYLDNPTGIDMEHPRFSWILNGTDRNITQAAYQVQVSASREQLMAGRANQWDTGKIKSDKSINIAYDGKNLESDQSYYWRVRVWGTDGEVSDWSRMAKFHTGLMHKGDWKGKWIAASDTAISAPIVRKNFIINKKVKEAYIHVAGLGYYELYINGGKVGNHVLDPGTTNYNERVLYSTYDISNYLNDSTNAVGAWLGNGYYNHRTTQKYGDRPKLLLQINIKYADGSTSSIVTDKRWKVSSSPILANSIYDGEVYDARKEQEGWSSSSFDSSDWRNVIEVDGPDKQLLEAQLMPPIRVTKTLRPINITEPQDGVYLFDFGQNLTGWPRLHINGQAGEKIVMRTAEITQSDMARMKNVPFTGSVDTIDTSPNRSAKARDTYILKGSSREEVYEPRFTYHGFRYVQVEGLQEKPTLETIEARVVHSDVEKVGHFTSSNTLLNRIHENILWGQLGNLFSIPTDCPQRDERQGWLGDAHLVTIESMYNFDMAAFYTKYLRDIQLSQNKNGSVPDLVPLHKYTHLDEGTPAWQVAYPLMVWDMHKFYEDNRILKQHYNDLKQWISYMKTLAENHIIKEGRGDWVQPKQARQPDDGSIPITSTAYYYKSVNIMADIALILNKKEDADYFTTLSGKIKHAFNQKFWNPKENTYGSGSQTSNAFPLHVGLVDEEKVPKLLDNLVSNIKQEHQGHIATGILGAKALVDVLPKYGHSDILYEMTTKKTFPSWGYMIAKGATTLWERWGGYRFFDAKMNSLNHIMFGSIDEFFYKNMAGIQVESPGFKNIVIKPEVLGEMNYAEASVKTIRGTVASEWKREGNAMELKVKIPPNSSAKIYIPKDGLSGDLFLEENGKLIWSKTELVDQNNQIINIGDKSKAVVVEVGSGTYLFTLRGNK